MSAVDTQLRLRLAVAMAAFCAATTAVYVTTRADPAPVVGLLLSGGPTLMVVLWMCKDAEQRRIAAVTDLGFFLVLFWPFVLPWYAFASRGRSGWKLLLGLLVLMLSSPLTAVALYLLRFS